MKAPKAPHVPEIRNVHGAGVEVWNAAERNSDKRTSHAALKADSARRKRTAAQIAENIPRPKPCGSTSS